MKREDIIRMAQEAGFEVHERKQQARVGIDALLGVDSTEKLQRFAALVAAAEREACATVCETAEVPIDIDVWMGTKKALTAATAIGLATAIRKRSNAESNGGASHPTRTPG